MREPGGSPRTGYISPMANTRHHPFAPVLAGAAVTLLSLPGCQETLTQVDSRVIAPATRPALDLSGSLPRLADVVASGGHGSDGTGGARLADVGAPASQQIRAAILARWEASWSHGTARGGRIREEIYRSGDFRALDFDPAAIRSAVESVRAALAEVDLISGPLPPRLTHPLSEARRLVDMAEPPDDVPSSAGSALDALRAADALREISPRAVALTVVESAGEALAAAASDVEPAADSYTRRRAERLTAWARTAIATGDYARAIERGYYACHLLGVSIP